MPIKPVLSVFHRLAVLPRTHGRMCATLPMHMFQLALGIAMMCAAEIGDAGGCSFRDKRDVPLSRWLSTIGFMLFLFMQLQ